MTRSVEADLAVAGSTPAGIAMALRAAREGLRAVLFNRHPHLGGMLASGLGVWDTRLEGARAPVYDEIRAAIIAHYRERYGAGSPQHRDAVPGTVEHGNGKFEAHVAERVITQRVRAEPNVTVLAPCTLRSAERRGPALVSVTLESPGGAVRVAAPAFADCTYEGDLMALAGAPFRIGRESRAEHGEPHAGRIFMRRLEAPRTPEHAALAAAHARLRLRRFRSTQEVAHADGAADPAVQAINYRTLLTDDPANRVPPRRPDGYDPARYRGLEHASLIAPIPNRKFCWNRPQLLDLQTAYAHGDEAARAAAMDAHWEAVHGLLWYLQHDAKLPPAERAFWQSLGLAADEFADNGHRPYEIYVREARRLAGRTVFTEHDTTLAPGLERTRVQRDSVGVAEWYIDSHACGAERREGTLREGVLQLYDTTFPAQVPYRCLLPPGLDNLLVPVCLSASHVGFQAVRLEATWMNLAEAAAVAVILAHGHAPAAVPPDSLARALAERRIMTALFNDVPMDGPGWVPAVQYFAGSGFFPRYDAEPDAPLTEAVAEAWLAAGDDPNARAARVLAAERTASAPVSGDALRALAARRGLTLADGPLTRGAACARLFEAGSSVLPLL